MSAAASGPSPGLDRVNAVARRPLYEEAADSIRAAILSGRFGPGERLHEPELAKSLGLSRGPVREALRKLEQEGIVLSSPHHGAAVVTVEHDEILDAIALREYLETFHCDRVVANVTPELLQSLERAVEQMQAATREGDLLALTDADFGFHDLLIGAAGSGLTKRVWRLIAGQLRMSLALSDPIFMRDNGDVAATHQTILDALEKRDAKALESALLDHMRNVGPLLQSHTAEAEHPGE
jgi:DNA-binding GntR family transcriptional regulator